MHNFILMMSSTDIPLCVRLKYLAYVYVVLHCIFFVSKYIFFFIPSGQLLMHSGMVVGSINYFFFHFSAFHVSSRVLILDFLLILLLPSLFLI